MIMWNEKLTQEKAQFNFKGILEYSEFTMTHVDEYVFVGGFIGDRNKGLVVALHGSLWHCTCMTRMQVVVIPTNAYFPLCDESFL